jgi:hypothetical protein
MPIDFFDNPLGGDIINRKLAGVDSAIYREGVYNEQDEEVNIPESALTKLSKRVGGPMSRHVIYLTRRYISSSTALLKSRSEYIVKYQSQKIMFKGPSFLSGAKLADAKAGPEVGYMPGKSFTEPQLCLVPRAELTKAQKDMSQSGFFHFLLFSPFPFLWWTGACFGS